MDGGMDRWDRVGDGWMKVMNEMREEWMEC